jgi:outer membrane lipoprotein SlyB
MKTFSRIMMAGALAATTATAFEVPAEARTRHHHRHHYYGQTYYQHKVCRYSRGSTGLIAGGVGGALVGHSILGHGLLGTAAGAVGGAVAGRAIDRASTAHRRCYYR